jgi:hypothetical protein
VATISGPGAACVPARCLPLVLAPLQPAQAQAGSTNVTPYQGTWLTPACPWCMYCQSNVDHVIIAVLAVQASRRPKSRVECSQPNPDASAPTFPMSGAVTTTLHHSKGIAMHVLCVMYMKA